MFNDPSSELNGAIAVIYMQPNFMRFNADYEQNFKWLTYQFALKTRKKGYVFEIGDAKKQDAVKFSLTTR